MFVVTILEVLGDKKLDMYRNINLNIQSYVKMNIL